MRKMCLAFFPLFSVVLFSLALSLAPSSAKAEEDHVTALKSSPSSSMVFEGSSEYNRIQKQYSLYLESASGAMYGGGLGVAYFLKRNTQILVDAYGYTSNVYNHMFDWVTGVHDKVQGSSVGIHYKQFFGNSFFLRGGLDQRRIQVDRTRTGGIFRFKDSERVSSFEGTATNLAIGIGNDWQWSNFTLGFDWYRVYLPIASRITREEHSELSDHDSFQSQQDFYLREKSAMIGFHLGASF